MGYDLHITRAQDWSQNDRAQITYDEWMKYVAGDPELALDSSSDPPLVRWNGPSTLPEPWLQWSEANISTKNPDDLLINKMIQIASALEAHVQGDDGESYSGPGPHTQAAPAPATKSWFRRLLGLR